MNRDRTTAADVIDEFSVTAERDTATVRYLETRMGRRVEFFADGDGDETRLQADPLALESLAWQDEDTFEELLGLSYVTPEIEGSIHISNDTVMTNEYAHVELCRVRSETGDLDCFRITAPKKRQQLLLDGTEVVALAQHDYSVFSTFLETPHGPDDDH